MIKLSERLKTVYENLLPEKDVWDICCDHGLLGQAAHKSENFSHVYFVDRVPEIMSRLKTQFRPPVLDNSTAKATFICTEGQGINTHVTGTVCITGVGASTILKILEGLSQNSFLHADRLILGPHRDKSSFIDMITSSPKTNHYRLVSEINLVEKNIEFSLFILDRIKN